MNAEQVEQWRAKGVQARLKAREAAAPSLREQGIWSRIAFLHQIVGCRHLNPDWAKSLVFLEWLHRSGHLVGPSDGAVVSAPNGVIETPSLTTVNGDNVTVPAWPLRRLTARCRSCGRFVRGRVPTFCGGCSAAHCPYCLVPNGCEHLLAVVADGEVHPPIVDLASLPILNDGEAIAQELEADEVRAAFGPLYSLLSAYTDGLGTPPHVGHLTRLLLEIVNYPNCVVVRDPGANQGALDRDCHLFAWRPEVARERIGQVVAELGRAFERLAAVIGEGVPPPVSLTERHKRGRRRRRSDPADILVVKCSGTQHQVSLPSRGPIVLLDHPDPQLVEAMLARPDSIEGCLLVLRYVRGRASYNPYGWYKWLVHVAPSFGRSGAAIRDRLREFDQRRTLRRLLRDVDLG